jgi:hypothetical protein
MVSKMPKLTIAKQFQLQELAAQTMRLRDALVVLGFNDEDVDKLVMDKETQSLFREGRKRGEQQLVKVVTESALAGNMSAAKLLVSRRDDNDDSNGPAPLDATSKARLRMALHEIVEHVREGFREQRKYVEANIRAQREGNV